MTHSSSKVRTLGFHPSNESSNLSWVTNFIKVHRIVTLLSQKCHNSVIPCLHRLNTKGDVYE